MRKSTKRAPALAIDSRQQELPLSREYLLVSDLDSKVLLSRRDYNEVKRLAGLIRRANGQCTIFKSTEG